MCYVCSFFSIAGEFGMKGCVEWNLTDQQADVRTKWAENACFFVNIFFFSFLLIHFRHKSIYEEMNILMQLCICKSAMAAARPGCHSTFVPPFTARRREEEHWNCIIFPVSVYFTSGKSCCFALVIGLCILRGQFICVINSLLWQTLYL